MNQYLGWAQGSDMPSTYVHLSGREVDDALLKLNGMAPVASKCESLLKPATCTRCSTINDAQTSFCRQCGLPVNVPAALRADEMTRESENQMAALLQDASVQHALREALVRHKLRTQPATSSLAIPSGVSVAEQ
jgi:hypothetical protein